MNLMQNIPERRGRGRYALIRLDKLAALGITDEQLGNMTAMDLAFLLIDNDNADELIEFGEPGSAEEFFAIKLKDANSPVALVAYSDRINNKDPEMADDVLQLVTRAGQNHPNCKDPD